MNLILFDEPFDSILLPANDPRAKHILKVLRAKIGSHIYIGFEGSVRARAEITAITADGAIEISVIKTEMPPAPLPITILAGMTRPHTAGRILYEGTTLGVSGIHFFPSERGEPSYSDSSLWTTDKWRDRLRLGAEQGFTTYLPEIVHHHDLESAAEYFSNTPTRICLDNYESPISIGQAILPDSKQCVIAIGSERGWSAKERITLTGKGWSMAHMGPNVLRTETAATAAIASIAALMQLWKHNTIQ